MKKILFPLDRPENLQIPLSYCLNLAEKLKAQVIIFHAYDLSNDFSVAMSRYGTSDKPLSELEKILKKNGADLLKKIESEFSERGIIVKTVLLRGKPEREIISTAQKYDCDLIIIGRRSFSTLKSFLLGSVSDYVIHHSEIPVLVVN